MTRRHRVIEHENGKEYFVENIETGSKIGFGALSFTNAPQAAILATALDTAYVQGMIASNQEISKQIEGIFK